LPHTSDTQTCVPVRFGGLLHQLLLARAHGGRVDTPHAPRTAWLKVGRQSKQSKQSTKGVRNKRR
jgi:hypothetical protein